MRGVTKEEWQTLQDAWKIWIRLRPDLDDFATYRNKAAGRWWGQSVGEYIGDISDKGLVVHGIDSHDESDWDSISTEFTTEELLNLEELNARNKVLADVIDETRKKEMEDKAVEQRRATYEAMKKEFGDA